MDIATYLEESAKTDSKKFFADNPKSQSILHAAIGLSTESGEILDNLKKHVYYGNDIDEVNIKEEMGDIMWYMAILMREMDLDFEELLDSNIRKLRKRYGEKFSMEASDSRDHEEEMKVL